MIFKYAILFNLAQNKAEVYFENFKIYYPHNCIIYYMRIFIVRADKQTLYYERPGFSGIAFQPGYFTER